VEYGWSASFRLVLAGCGVGLTRSACPGPDARRRTLIGARCNPVNALSLLSAVLGYRRVGADRKASAQRPPELVGWMVTVEIPRFSAIWRGSLLSGVHDPLQMAVLHRVNKLTAGRRAPEPRDRPSGRLFLLGPELTMRRVRFSARAEENETRPPLRLTPAVYCLASTVNPRFLRTVTAPALPPSKSPGARRSPLASS
jgi:hypothetical protein